MKLANESGDFKVSNGFKLEKAKILFACEQLDNAQTLLIDLIRSDPDNEIYWVVLYLILNKKKNGDQGN